MDSHRQMRITFGLNINHFGQLICKIFGSLRIILGRFSNAFKIAHVAPVFQSCDKKDVKTHCSLSVLTAPYLPDALENFVFYTALLIS